MSVDETSERRRPSPPEEHHFQTPIVREQPTGGRRPGGAPREPAEEEPAEPEGHGERPPPSQDG